MRSIRRGHSSFKHALLQLSGGAVVLTGAPSVWAANPPESCSRTSINADVHTCIHGTAGPFAARVAIPYPHSGSPLDIQNVDPTHTLYTILLSEPSETDQWVVSYASDTPGTFAFYLDVPGTSVFEEPPYEFELRDSFGDSVPLRLEHVVTQCPGYLSWVKVYELPSGRYHLVLTGEPSDNVQVAIEHLEAFPQNLFVDADGDGYGRYGASLSSWCGEAEGYSAVDTDCDDEDHAVFPNIEGVCSVNGSCDGDDPPEHCAGGSGGTSGTPPETGGMGGALGDSGGGSNADAGGSDGGSGTGGRRDSQGGAGSEPSEGLVGSHGDGGSDGGESPIDGSGCSCRVGDQSTRGGGWPTLLGIACLVLLRRARDRVRS